MRETNLKFSEGSVEVYERFKSQWSIHCRMLFYDDNRAGVELYISLEDKAALKLEEVVESADGTWDITKMLDALNHAFLPIDHRESRYRHFTTRCTRQGEIMTEYLDELICLFRKARRLCNFKMKR